MKITEVVPQKKDSSRFNIYIENKFFCGASVDIIAKFNIYQGKDIDEQELNELLLSELESRFFNRVLTYLSRSQKTEYQIRIYLRDLSYKKKGQWYQEIEKEKLEEIFEKVISKCKEYKYIDDERFAEAFVTSRIKNKPRGKGILKSELMAKGVQKEIAERVVNNMVEDEIDMLKRVYTKKYGNEPLKMKERKKVDFLRRKGFTWDLIQQIIQE